jgi:hypothetical protein
MRPITDVKGTSLRKDEMPIGLPVTQDKQQCDMLTKTLPTGRQLQTKQVSMVQGTCITPTENQQATSRNSDIH